MTTAEGNAKPRDPRAWRVDVPPADADLVSVVIPFFQEEGNVGPLLEELLPVLDGLPGRFEVVAVDDGSTDGTAAALAAGARRDRRVRVVTMARNSGQSAAFLAGFRAARGALVVTMDGDRQIDPRDVPALLVARRERGVDFVYGRRKRRSDGWLKKLSTRIGNGVRNAITGDRLADTGCPLKLLPRDLLLAMPAFNGMHRFYVTLAHVQGATSCEVPVEHRARVSGASKYGVWNRAWRGLADCFAVRWLARRHLATRVAPPLAAGPHPAGGVAEADASRPRV